MNIKVSIIVPVYNVQEYLDRCVKSLLNQTISGYNIILVDDGSTDESGNKCDYWASTSELITVLHKSNGGLSDARNYGITRTIAKYVTFVDSDDYVEPQYLEKLIEGLKEGVDMVVTNHVQENEGELSKTRIYETYDIYTTEQGLEKLCYEEISTSAWGKLLPRTFIEEDPFPVGKLYEDLLTIYKYIGKSNKIAFNRSETYHYVQRSGSIRKGKWNPRSFDVMDGASNLLKYLDKNYPSLHACGVFRYFYSANEFYVRAFSSQNYLKVIQPIRKKLKKNLKIVLLDGRTSLKYKIQFFLMVVNPGLYKKIWLKIKEKTYYANQ